MFSQGLNRVLNNYEALANHNMLQCRLKLEKKIVPELPLILVPEAIKLEVVISRRKHTKLN